MKKLKQFFTNKYRSALSVTLALAMVLTTVSVAFVPAVADAGEEDSIGANGTSATQNWGDYTNNAETSTGSSNEFNGSWDGKNNDAHVYIREAKDFNEFFWNVNNGKTYEGQTVHFTKNITLTGAYTTNYKNNTQFKGTLDGDLGDGKMAIITSMNRNVNDQAQGGIFNYTMGATIKNLVFKNATVNGYKGVAIIANNAKDTTFENVHMYDCKVANATSGQYDVAGAFTGYAAGTSFKNCSFTGSNIVNDRNTSSASVYSYGAVSKNWLSQENGWSGLGGTFAAQAESSPTGKKVVIDDCYVDTVVQSRLGQIGGFVGKSTSDCQGVEIKNSTMNGFIKLEDIGRAGSGVADFGGLIGRAESDVSITSTVNNASASGKRVIGGFVGYAAKGLEIISSANNGNVTLKEAAGGGLVGLESSTGTKTIKNSYNTGNIDGIGSAGEVGGIVGNAGTSTIENCFNAGSVNGSTGGYGGGITGCIGSGTISVKNCLSIGNTPNYTNYGALSSETKNSSVFQNNYYANAGTNRAVGGQADSAVGSQNLARNFNIGLGRYLNPMDFVDSTFKNNLGITDIAINSLSTGNSSVVGAKGNNARGFGSGSVAMTGTLQFTMKGLTPTGFIGTKTAVRTAPYSATANVVDSTDGTLDWVVAVQGEDTSITAQPYQIDFTVKTAKASDVPWEKATVAITGPNSFSKTLDVTGNNGSFKDTVVLPTDGDYTFAYSYPNTLDGAVTKTVKASKSITTANVAISPTDSKPLGTEITVTGEVSDVVGGIDYTKEATLTIGGTNYSLDRDGSAKFNPTSAGEYEIVFSYLGNDSNATSSSTAKFTVVKETPTITFSDQVGTTYNGTAYPAKLDAVVNHNYTATPSAVQYTYYIDAACETKTTAQNSGASTEGGAPVFAGNYWIKATFEGNDFYNEVSETKGFTIAKAEITATVSVDDKTYDGTNDATASNIEIVGAVTADNVQLVASNLKFADSNAGENKNVTGTLAFAEGETNAKNYKIDNDNSTYTNATISKKDVTVTITANDKIYDGKTDATFKSATIANLIDADKENVTATATGLAFGSVTSGKDKTVTVDVADVILSGTNSTNYNVSSATVENATIEPKKLEIAISPITIYRGQYSDGFTFDDFQSSISVSGFVNGETIESLGKDYKAPKLAADINGKEAFAQKSVTATNSVTENGNYSYDETVSFLMTCETKEAIEDVDFVVETEDGSSFTSSGWTGKTVTVSAHGVTRALPSYDLVSKTADASKGTESIIFDASASKDETTFYLINSKDGTISAPVTGLFGVDMDAPTEVSISEVDGNALKKIAEAVTFGLFYNSNRTYKVTATDELSGIASLKVTGENTVSGASDVNETIAAEDGTFQINGQFVGNLKVVATDNVGNSTTEEFEYFAIDTVKPATPTVAFSDGYTEGNWSDKDVVVTVSGSTAVSGINKYEYSTDNGANWIAMADGDVTAATQAAPKNVNNATITISTAGTTEIQFRAVSNSINNSDATTKYTLKIDKTAPTEVKASYEESKFFKALSTATFGLFFKENVNVTLSATDDESGIASYFYKLNDDSEFTEVKDGKFSIDKQFLGNFEFYATNKVGVASDTITTEHFTMDSENPTAPKVTGFVNDGYAKDSVTIGVSSEALSGIKSYEILVKAHGDADYATSDKVEAGDETTVDATDETPKTVSSQKFTLRAKDDAKTGEYSYKIIATSNSGLTSESFLTVNFSENPQVSVDAGSYATGTWTNKDITFIIKESTDAFSNLTFSFTRQANPSSSDWTAISANADGKSATYSLNSNTNGPVVFRIGYKVNAGDTDVTYVTSKPIDVKLQKTRPGRPEVQLEGNKAATGWYTTDVTATITEADATDPTFAPASVYYKINGGLEIKYTTPLTLNNGTNTLVVYAKDDAGNKSNEFSQTIKVDTVKPVVTGVTVNSNALREFLNSITFGKFFKSSVTVKVTATETGSGIKEYRLTGNSLDETNSTGEFTVSPAFVGNFKVVVVDNAGNESEAKRYEGVAVDSQAPLSPTVSFEDYRQDTWTDKDVVIVLTGIDVPSGLAKYQYSTNDGQSWTDLTSLNSTVESRAATATVPATVQRVTYKISKNTNATYCFRTVSNTGIESGKSTGYKVKIDKDAPDSVTVSATSGGSAYTSGTWTAKPVLFTLSSGTVGNSGVTYKYSTDKSNWLNVAGNTLTVNKDTQATYYFMAVSGTGKESAVSTGIEVKIQVTAPSAPSIDIAGTVGTNGWYTTIPTIQLATSSTTVRFDTYYRVYEPSETGPDFTKLDNNNKPKISSDGEYTVETYNINDAGTQSVTTSVAVKVDTSAPVEISATKKNGNAFQKLAQVLTFGLFFNSSTEIEFSSTDYVSAVDHYEYTLINYNGRETGTTTKSVSIPGDFKGNFEVVAVDKAGNKSEKVAFQKFAVDAENPTVIKVDTSKSTEWVTAPVEFNLSLSTALSGIDKYEYSVEDGVWVAIVDGNDDGIISDVEILENKATPTQPKNVVSASFNVSKIGETQIKFRAVSNSDLATETKAYTVKLDNVKPVISLNLNSYDGSWINQDVTIKPVLENAVASGVTYKYSTDGGATWNDTDAANGVKIAADFNGTYSFKAISSTEIQSDVVSQAVKVQKTVPATVDYTISSVDGTNGWYKTNPTISITGKAISETTAPIASVSYKLYTGENDPSDFTKVESATATPIVNADGEYTLKYFVTDEAGNDSETVTQTFNVDTAIPTEVKASYGENKFFEFLNNATFGLFFKETVEVSLTADDATSVVEKFNVTFENAKKEDMDAIEVTANADGKFAFNIEPQFVGNFSIVATDKAGNATTSQKTEDFIVDANAPTVPTIDFGDYTTDTWSNTEVEVTASGATADSGIAKYEYSVDGGTTWTAMTGTAEVDANPANIASATATLSLEGSHTYSFRAVSNSGVDGNVTAGQIVKIDTVKPIVSVDTDSYTPGEWTKEDVVVTLSNTAGNTSLITYSYSTDNGANWTDIASNGTSLTINADTNATYIFKAISEAKVESDETIGTDIKVQKTAPAAPIVEIRGDATDGWHSTYPEITISASALSDSSASIQSISYTTTKDGVIIDKYIVNADNVTFSITKDGNYKIEAFAIDVAGNESAIETVEFKADTTAPTLITAVDKANPLNSFLNDITFGLFFKETVTVELTASDDSENTEDVSGIKQFDVTFVDTYNKDAIEVTANADGKFEFDIEPQFVGKFTVSATDNAGNVSISSASQGTAVDKNAPTSPTVSFSDGYVSGTWTNKEVVVTVSSATADSGIKEYQYSTDGGTTWNKMTGEIVTAATNGAPRNVTSATFTVDTEGTTKIVFRSVSNSDVVGNETAYQTIKLDTTAPTNVTASYGENKFFTFLNKVTFGLFFKETVEVTFTAEDATSGVEKFDVTFENAKKDMDAIEVTANNDGKFTFNIEPQFVGSFSIVATDKAGNATISQKTENFIVDANAPTVPTIDFGDYTTDTWSDSAVEVTVSGATADSGIAKYEYNVDGGTTWTEMTGTAEVDANPANLASATATLSIEGNHTYSFRAVSNSGVDGTAAVDQIVKIDTVAPTDVKASYGENKFFEFLNNATFGLFFKETVEVSLTADDATSGVEKFNVTFENAKKEDMDAIEVTANADGKFAFNIEPQFVGNFSIVATDKAGNATTSQKTEDFIVDANAPTVPTIDFGDYTTDTWSNTEVEVTVSSATAESGIAKYEYNVDGGETWTAMTGTAEGDANPANIASATATLSLEGNHTYSFRAVSNSGVDGTATAGQIVKIDTVKPIVSVDTDSYTPGEWTKEDVVVTLSNTAGNTSLITYSYSTDNGANWTDIASNGTSLTINADTNATYIFKAISEANVESDETIGTDVKVQKTAPTESTYAINPEEPDGLAKWYLTVPEITLTGTGLGGTNAPLKSISYRTFIDENNKGDFTTTDGETVTWKVASQGNVTLEYFITDEAGNNSGTVTKTFKVDATAPTGLSVKIGDDKFLEFLNTVTFGLFFKETVTVTVDAEDLESGIKDIKVQVFNSKGGVTNKTCQPGDTFTLDPQFVGNITIFANDKAGNATDMQAFEYFAIDGATPDNSGIKVSTGEYQAGTWSSKDVVITLSGATADSGIEKYQYKLAGTDEWKDATPDSVTPATYNNPANVVSAKVTASEDGISNYQFRVVSNSGMVSDATATSTTVKIDKTTPVVNVQSSYSFGSWTNSDVTINVSNDATNSSPVTYKYSANGGATWSDIADGKVVISADTNANYTFKATSEAGLENVSESYEVKVQKTVPTTVTYSISSVDGTNGWYKTNPTLSITGVANGEATAPIASVSYKLYTGTEPSSFTAVNGTTVSSTVNEDGEYTLKYFVTDVAGNNSATVTQTFKVDTAAPTTITAKTSTDPVKDFLNGVTFGLFFKDTVTVNLTATDPTSGVDKFNVSFSNAKNLDMASQTITASNGTASFNVEPQFVGNFTVVAVDKASNASTEVKANNFAVDKIGSTSDIVVSTPDYTGNWTTKDVVVSVSGATADSGIKEYQYSTDDGANWTGMTENVVSTLATSSAPANVSSADVTVSAQGTTNIVFRAVSNSGVESTKTAPTTVKIDKTVPVIKVDTTGKIGAWTNENVEFALSNTASNASSVSFKYSIDGTTWLDVENGNMVVSNDTNATYTFKATSEAGLENVSGSYEVKVQKTVPTTVNYSISSVDGTNGWYKTNPTMSITGEAISETTAPIASVSYMLYTGTEPSSFTVVDGKTATPVVSGDGEYTLKYFATDVAGNNSAAETKTFKVDKTVPTAEITVKTASFKDVISSITFGIFVKDTVQTTIKSSDALSGVSTVEFQKVAKGESYNVNGSWTKYTAPIDVAANAEFAIYAKVTDNAGHISIVNTNGIVVYTDSILKTTEARFCPDKDETREGYADVAIEMNLNGNTLKEITLDGKALVAGTDYTVSGDTVTLLKEYLAQVVKADTIFTFAFNPMGETYVSGGINEAPATASFKVVKLTHVAHPVVTSHLADKTVYNKGETTKELKVEATVPSGVLTYQWYLNGQPIDGATKSTYSPLTATNGIFEYYVSVTNTDTTVNGEQVSIVNSNVATVIVKNSEVVLPVIGEGTPAITVVTDTEVILNDNLTDEDRANIENGYDIRFVIEVKAKSNVSDADKEELKKAVSGNILDMFEIVITKVVTDEKGVTTEQNITKLAKDIQFAIQIPEADMAEGRTFAINRLHYGKVTELADVDSNSNVYTFESSEFSAYALSYKEAEKVQPTQPTTVGGTSGIKGNNGTQTPATGDNSTNAPYYFVAVSGVVLLAIVIEEIIRKKKAKQNQDNK